MNLQFVHLSPERRDAIIADVRAGSDPHWRFYALLIASCMIASLGLSANSTAVIIGAMLVSPLMMPIFGVALGMLHGAPGLWSKAVVAEFGGACLAIGSAYLVGLTNVTAGEATPEMLARTQPNLIDLLVAIFAGFAGAYALVDERISPALPGVAIATAIVPPLSTCGLCLALGSWQAAGGALLLFLANFVAILIVALILFGITGLSPHTRITSWKYFFQRFGLTMSSFLVITIVLTNSLVHITRERRIKNTIKIALSRKLESFTFAELEDFIYSEKDGRTQLLAIVRSPQILTPARVSEIQDAVEDSLQSEVDLVVRTQLSKDVAARGQILNVSAPDANGNFLTERVKDNTAMESIAEQVIRERFEEEPGFELTQVDYGIAQGGRGLVLAYINTARRLKKEEIAVTEDALRERLEDDDLRLLVRVNTAELEYRGGPVRMEWTAWFSASGEELTNMPANRATIRRIVGNELVGIPVSIHFNYLQGRRRVLVEIVGPDPITPEMAENLQTKVESEIGPTELYLWYRNQYVVSGEGYSTYEQLSDPELETRRLRLQEIFQTELRQQPEPIPAESAVADSGGD